MTKERIDRRSAHGHVEDDVQPPGSTWDRRFSEIEWPDRPDAKLVEFIEGLTPRRAVDLGCGPGRNAIWLARAGWTVTGVDASAVGLDAARERAAKAGVSIELVQADVRRFTFLPGSFDLVVVANLHFPPNERDSFFAGLVSRLAPGGHLFVVGHHRDSAGRAGPPFPERLYTEELLERLLAPLDVEVQRFERPAAPGEPPLVDAVAWATMPVRGGEGS